MHLFIINIHNLQNAVVAFAVAFMIEAWTKYDH